MNSNSQYPTQPTYPVQSPGNPVSPKFLHLPQAPPYTDALPAYQSSVVQAFIPPPPPGCPLNTAQLAIMQRAKVLVTQRKGNFFTDVSDGGYFIW
ncbi:DAZ-associated protein 2-like isoform X2 [Mus caroli]|uniref:DAZ-associated protein 2 n=1 Tax=Mus caroli TaxID=10089 RepID=A0A6P5PA03_MUSCR|nr:DAZ-associated protein 2-like isoform X2 [Mus caroli]